MKSLIIPIHSFIDVITNSSSETYIYADKGTIDAIKKIINGILIGAGSTKTCDDLFDVTLEGTDVRVLAKGDDINLAEAGRLLSNITGYFEIESEYNG